MNKDLVEEYRREARRVGEDALHSSKGHYNASTRWRKVHIWIGIPNALLAAVAGVSAFKGSEQLAGWLAVAVAAVSAVSTFLNPSDRSAEHKRCAAAYHALRNQARIFVNIELMRSKDDGLQLAFEEIVAKRDDLNASSPQVPRWAFEEAKSGIEAGEATYKEGEE